MRRHRGVIMEDNVLCSRLYLNDLHEPKHCICQISSACLYLRLPNYTINKCLDSHSSVQGEKKISNQISGLNLYLNLSLLPQLPFIVL